MSTTFNPAVQRSNAAGALATAGGAAKRWLGALIARRIEEAAITQLKSMSDRELKDIGLTRSQIEAAVRGIVDLERDRTMIKYI